MESLCSCDLFADFYQSTWCYIPEDSTYYWEGGRVQVYWIVILFGRGRISSTNSGAVCLCTARVFSRDSPGKVAQWTGRTIREIWGVLWLVIRLLSVRVDVPSSVRSILLCTERLYCVPLDTCHHVGALPATTNTSPTPRRRTVRTKYYYCRVSVVLWITRWIPGIDL
jgi:hypothetical protein